MSVRLHLPQIRVLGVVEDTAARLVVGVESTEMPALRVQVPQGA